jgi:ribonuclease Y
MIFLFLVLGTCAGATCAYVFFKIKKGGLEKLAQDILANAEQEAQKKSLTHEFELKKKTLEHRETLEKLSHQKLEKIHSREDKLDRQLALIEKKLQEVERREKELARSQQKTKELTAELEDIKLLHLSKLQSLASMSAEEAKKMLFEQFSQDVKNECSVLLFKQKKEIEEEAGRYAATLIATAINRLSLPTVSEVAALMVSLPNHEIKGRVIGREGRNIRVLEQATGVSFVIDDTPNAVVISGFDPIRKEIARIALKDLIQDGRIHPTSIEEAVAKAEAKVNSQIKQYGKEAAIKAGCLSFHPEIIQYLGQLHFRYSYGQNVLAHSLEVCYLMGIMASELHLDCEKAKRIGLLHDIGKAVSHEVEGSHALIGQQIALKLGESEEVANGIGCHHEEILPQTLEASLCSAADRISGGRPGARSEALEHYLKRSAKLEQISKQFEGVEKAFAMHAGREVRVLVEPERFDDAGTLLLAREIAKKIEKELSYQGTIKVTVIRERKAVEYAS